MTDDRTAPLATVTICTRNRADSLARTLASVAEAAQHVSDPWEMVVVDNGSSDHTPEVIDRFTDRLPLRRVVQDIPGLSNARNAGVAAARGQFIIWTDDDVLVDAQWLASYLAAFAANPAAGIFGGRAVPRYEEPRQDWFIRMEAHLEGLLAIRDHPEWTDITLDRLPYGLNYAMRSDLQRRFAYDPALGVAPGRRVGGEETDVIRRALADGATGRWVWDATVYHLITPERQTADYIYAYYFSQGVLYYKFANAERGLRRLRRFGGLAIRILRRQWSMRRLRARGDETWVLSHMEYARLRGNWQRLRQSGGFS